jgi:hypothetical protein
MKATAFSIVAGATLIADAISTAQGKPYGGFYFTIFAFAMIGVFAS